MNTLTEIEIRLQSRELYDSLHSLLRPNGSQLQVYLDQVACSVSIPKTKTQAHCYFVTLDGNHRPRVNDFARFTAQHVVDYAIPRSEVSRALNDALVSGSTVPITRLNSKASRLFTRLPNSGEGGEILLSLMAEAFLEIPQIFTKMTLKTSSQMHLHGSDAIHAGVNDQGNLALYWGESKMYASASAAIKACFGSLAPWLLDAGGSSASQERDLQLLRDGLSLDDPLLLEALKHFLNPNDPQFNKMEYRGLCLVGFDSHHYPTTADSTQAMEMRQAIEATFDENRRSIGNRVATERLASFVIEIFCVPFPSVDEFRRAFREELGLEK